MLLPNMDRISVVQSLQGNIGSGKTTLMRELKKSLCHRADVVFVEEPVDDWQVKRFAAGTQSMLSAFYGDPAKYAFAFQVNAFCTRQRANVAASLAIPADVTHATLITERSMSSDNHIFRKAMFESGQICEVSNHVYQEFSALVTATWNQKERVMIYLDVDYRVCHERLRRRARGEEIGVTLQYLAQLQQKHEEMLSEFSAGGGMVIRVPWIDTADDSEQRAEIVRDILRQMLTPQ